MEFKHIELHSPEAGKYFVKCYKSEKPELKKKPTSSQVFKRIKWKQSEVIYPVHESQVEGFKAKAAEIWIFNNQLGCNLDKVLEQGIPIPASKVEIRECGSNDGEPLPFPTDFAFLVEEVKEETNEAKQDYKHLRAIAVDFAYYLSETNQAHYGHEMQKGIFDVWYEKFKRK